MKNSLLLLLLFTFVFTSSKAQQDARLGYLGLSNNVGAREMALSGKAFALADGDIHIALQNPAAISFATPGSIALSYQSYFADAQQGYIGTSLRFKDSASFSFSTSLHYLDYGKFKETDVFGNDLGNFAVNDYLLKIGMAKKFSPNFSMGISVNTFYSNWYSYESGGIAADFSLLHTKPEMGFSFTALVKNIGVILNPLQTDDERRLPVNAAISIAKKLENAPFRFVITADELTRYNLVPETEIKEVKDPFSGELVTENEPNAADKIFRHLYWGTEIVFSESFNLRLGYSYRKRQELKMPDKPKLVGFSYGFSFRVSRFVMNYGRSILHASGPSHTLSLSINLKEYKNKRFEKN